MPTDSCSPTPWRPRPASRLRVGLSGWWLLFALGACGGGAKQTSGSLAPASPTEPSGIDAGDVDSSTLEEDRKGLDHAGATSLNEVVDELDAAEKKIAGLFGGLGSDDAAEAGDEEKPDAQPAPSPRDQAKPEANAGMPSNRCTTACRALESMQRSADRLCELVGGEDGRCDDARTRVTRAVSVVSSACPACQAARP